MKKFLKLITVSMLVLLLGACGSLSKRGSADLKKYNDIRVTFVTTQGDINFYLYPEAAPATVANFVNLALRGYYDNTIIHRAIENFMVQGGDPTGTGHGSTGYTIKDEFVEWLDFYQSGMLAMANAGPDTGSSQFFITLYPADFLNGKHTVFGEIVSQIDGEYSRKLEKGDVIKEVKISGHYDLLLALHKDLITEWNAILDQNYPNLKKYEIKDLSEFGDEVKQYQNELKEIYTPKEKKNSDDDVSLIPRMIRGIERKLKRD